MAKKESATAAITVPSFIRNLNQLAERCGISVGRVYVERDDEKPTLLVDWRSTETQLRSLGIVPPSWRPPMTTGLLVIGDVWWRHPILRGHVTLERRTNELLYQVNFGDVPCTIAERHGVEIIEYAEETAYHASRDALIALGIDSKHLPAGKRGSRSGHRRGSRSGQSYEAPDFYTRRQPDGSYVYWVQTEASFEREKRRHEEEKARWHAQVNAVPVQQPSWQRRERAVGRYQRLVRWVVNNEVIFPDWSTVRAAVTNEGRSA